MLLRELTRAVSEIEWNVASVVRVHAARARKYALWKRVADLDEESLKLLIGALPAWVKVRVWAL